MKTKREQLIDVLSGLDNEVVKIVTVTEQEALKKSRETGLPTPENLAVLKKYAVRHDQFVGTDYEKLVKKLRFKEAGFIKKVKKFIFGDGFKSQGTYTFPVTENQAVLEHTKTHKQYLRTLSAMDAPVESRYYDVDNTDVTDQWKSLQQEYFKLNYKNKSQGLDNPLRVNNTGLTNVKYIELSDGTVIYNELSNHTLKKLGVR